MNTNKRTVKSGFKENQFRSEYLPSSMNTIGGTNTVFNQDCYEQFYNIAPYYDSSINSSWNGYLALNKWFYDQSLSLNESIPYIMGFDPNFIQYMFSLFFCQCQNYEPSIPNCAQQDCNNESPRIIYAKQNDGLITISDEKSTGAELLSTELITKLFIDHACEMEKAKQQVFTELESFRQNSDIVFHQRSKPQKSQSDKGDKFRGSLYRGVSANGKSWQVFIVINKCKCYSGCAETEEKAAAIYDRLAIIFHGLRAKTNFSYSKADVLQCFEIAAKANK